MALIVDKSHHRLVDGYILKSALDAVAGIEGMAQPERWYYPVARGKYKLEKLGANYRLTFVEGPPPIKKPRLELNPELLRELSPSPRRWI